MNNLFEEIKGKVREWGVKDWEEGVNFKRMMCFDGENISKEEYFGMIEKMESFGDLFGFFNGLSGFDDGVEFSVWLDEVIKG